MAWLKIMAGEVSQFMSVLTADRFEGPYTFVRKIYKPLDMDTGDFCLHADEKSGKAYIWFERGGRKYLITSGTSGYYPNPSRVCVFDDYHGEYRDLGLICEGDEAAFRRLYAGYFPAGSKALAGKRDPAQ